jgi:lipoprotein YgeR
MPGNSSKILFASVGLFFSLNIHAIKDQGSMHKQNTYRVQSGDSWWGISKKLNLKPGELAALNGRKETDALYQNELLRTTGTSISADDFKVVKPKERPHLPLPSMGRIERAFSDVTHLPHKGIEYSHGKNGWVISTLPGKVVNIDYMDGYENYVILEHENGWYSVYANLERVQVVEGQILTARERIGTLVRKRGLYFQVNQNKNPINPSLFLQQGS